MMACPAVASCIRASSDSFIHRQHTFMKKKTNDLCKSNSIFRFPCYPFDLVSIYENEDVFLAYRPVFILFFSNRSRRQTPA